MSRVQVNHSWRWWNLARVNRDCHGREWSHSIVSSSPRKDRSGFYCRFFFGDYYDDGNAPDSDLDLIYFYADNPDSQEDIYFNRAEIRDLAHKLLELVGE